MARTSFIDAVSWSKLLIPRPAPVPGDAEHRESTIPRLCSWDLRSFRVCEAEPDGEPRDPLTEFLLVGATPGWRDVLPIAVDPPSKANRWEPIPTWEELALLNDTFDRRAKDEIGAAVLYLYEEDYDALGENVTLHAVPRSLLRAGRHPDLARTRRLAKEAGHGDDVDLRVAIHDKAVAHAWRNLWPPPGKAPRNPGGGAWYNSYHGLLDDADAAKANNADAEERPHRPKPWPPPLTDEQERAQAEERHQERLRLREAGEMERVYRALDRERQEKRRAEVEAGLFWPRSATGQDKKEL